MSGHAFVPARFSRITSGLRRAARGGPRREATRPGGRAMALLVICLALGLPSVAAQTPPTGKGSPPGPDATAAPSPTAARDPQASATIQDTPDGAALFEQLCARCHGLSGDGHGSEVLDRPARSFQAGGFSFGNTLSAIERTLMHGIPGSPMPGFAEALDHQQRLALARHVLSLAPPTQATDEADAVLNVGDHPVVARGALPPIADGEQATTRGLLLGLPGGFSFQYRVTDLALLGVRVGEFVRRTDWTGRGGTPLDPLGRVIWRADGGPSVLRVTPDGSQPLRCLLAVSRTPTAGATLEWQALAADGSPLARVTERPRELFTSLGSGFARSLLVSARGPDELRLRQAISPGPIVARLALPAVVLKRADGVLELDGLLVLPGSCPTSADEHGLSVRLPAAGARSGPADASHPTRPIQVTFVTLLLDDDAPPSADELLSALLLGLSR